MTDWQTEQVEIGIVLLCDRGFTWLEALVKLLENEIKLIHEKDGDTNE